MILSKEAALTSLLLFSTSSLVLEVANTELSILSRIIGPVAFLGLISAIYYRRLVLID